MKALSRSRIAAILACAALSAQCGDDEGDGSGGPGNGSGNSGGDGTAVGDLSATCRRICDIAFRCAQDIPGGGLSAEATRTLCLESCNQSLQDLDESEITQACLNAAEASLQCLEAADCALTLGGDACEAEDAALEAACPDTDEGEDCDFDCSLCSDPTTRATCQQTADACTDAACCSSVATTFAQCGAGSGPACNFDCSTCAIADQPICEQAVAACAPLSGSLRDTCCAAVESQLSTTCGDD